MKKKLAVFVVIVVAQSLIFAGMARAQVSDRMPAPSKMVFSLGAGYMLPNEGDLKGGGIAGLGMKYIKDTDVLFIDAMYSPTASKITLSGLDGDVKNTLIQFGYMKQFEKPIKFRIGGGVQIHEMNFSNIKRMTKSTLAGVIEYDINKDFTVRLETAPPVKNGTIRFGTDAIVMFEYNFCK